jgi:gas vesicle protein
MDFDFRRRHDNSPTMFLAGLATGLFAGALAMFIFDPEQGARRRALARDKAKDLGNRAYGLAKDAQGAVREKMGSEAAPAGMPEPARPL